MTEDHNRAFETALQSIVEVSGQEGVFAADDIITFHRHVGFRSDTRFLQSFFAAEPSDLERCLAWRLHVLCWAGDHASSTPGDFVQCGARSGLKAATVARYVDLGGVGKSFHVYDPCDARSPEAAEARRQRLGTLFGVVLDEATPLARVAAAAPPKIAWLHLDVAQASAEEMILEGLIGRVSPNGLVLVEEYGSNRRADSVAAADRIAAANNCAFMELPTGQGLLIKA